MESRELYEAHLGAVHSGFLRQDVAPPNQWALWGGAVWRRKLSTPSIGARPAHVVIDTGQSIAAVAAEINGGAQLLGRRVQMEGDRIGAPPEAVLEVSQWAELGRLRRENVERRLDIGKPSHLRGVTLPAGVLRGDRRGRKSLSSAPDYGRAEVGIGAHLPGGPGTQAAIL